MSGRILVVGDVMTDVVVIPEGPIVSGSDRRATIRTLPGGCGANQAVWLATFGADVRFLARVGTTGKARLDAQFRAHGVEPLLIADTASPTGTLVTIVDPGGERSFLTDRGANLNLSPGDLPGTLLDNTASLALTGYSFFTEGPRRAVTGLMAEAHARKIPIALDPASAGFLREVGPANFIAWTNGAALFVANADEAVLLTGEPEIAEQVRTLGQHYARVIIKRGPLGAVLGDAGGIRFIAAAPQVDAIDSTGAGDAFIAGFLAAELRGQSENACLDAAIAAGTRAVQQIGGQPSAD